MGNTNSRIKTFWTLITPSWLSGLLTIFTSLALVGGVVAYTRYQGSDLKQEIEAVQKSGASLFNVDAHGLTTTLAHNSIINNAPLFLFWASLGVVIYFFATSIWSAFNHAVELEHEMGYVNAPRHELVQIAITTSAVRFAIAAAWFGLLQLTLLILLPYVLSSARLASSSDVLQSVEYGLAAVVVSFLALQLHTICLRLLFLRQRLFS